MRTGFRVATAIAALIASFILAAPAAATDTWDTYRQSGTNAFAFSEACTEDPVGSMTCEGRYIDVFEGTIKQSGQPTRKGEQVCYSESSSTFDPDTGEGTFHGLFGCTLDAGSLTVDDLTSVTLAPTVIELTAIDCDAENCTESPGGSRTVDGTWIGVGPTLSQKGKFRSGDGDCMQVNADKGRFRQASFEGSIGVTDGMIGEGSFTFRTDCPF